MVATIRGSGSSEASGCFGVISWSTASALITELARTHMTTFGGKHLTVFSVLCQSEYTAVFQMRGAHPARLSLRCTFYGLCGLILYEFVTHSRV
jgi:hypothetical protein